LIHKTGDLTMIKKILAFFLPMLFFIFSTPYIYSGDPPSSRMEVKNSERYFLRLRSMRIKEPNNAELSYELGNYHFSLKSYDEAIKEYRRTLKIKPEHDYAKWFLSKALMAKGYNDEAFWLVRDLIIKHKNRPELYEYAGEILIKLDQINTAKEYFAKSEELLYNKKDGEISVKSLTKPNMGGWEKYFF
jgi:tetratricopeptide (TPR) repeat protein